MQQLQQLLPQPLLQLWGTTMAAQHSRQTADKMWTTQMGAN
jgi:hypothetical protein